VEHLAAYDIVRRGTRDRAGTGKLQHPSSRPDWLHPLLMRFRALPCAATCGAAVVHQRAIQEATRRSRGCKPDRNLRFQSILPWCIDVIPGRPASVASRSSPIHGPPSLNWLGLASDRVVIRTSIGTGVLRMAFEIAQTDRQTDRQTDLRRARAVRWPGNTPECCTLWRVNW